MLKQAGGRARPEGEFVARFSSGPIVPKLAVLVVLVGVIRIALRPAQMQHDVAMYLHAGQLLLRGQRPYVDFIDLNPPLIMYVSAIPAAFARVLGVSVVPTALLMTACAAALSLVVTRRTLIAAFAEAGADTLLAEVAILALAYALFLSDVPARMDLTFPGDTPLDPRLSRFFGQREHLFLIGSAPYVAVRFRRWEGGRTALRGAVLAGAVASLVTCLKPQFVLVLLAFEVGCWASKRALSPFRTPEVAAFMAVVLGYAAHFALLPASVKAAWFGRWLPFIIEGYGVFNEAPSWHLLLRCWPALGAIALAFGVSLTKDPLGRRLTRGFALMALGGAALYVAQRKGWTYHAFPMRTCSIVAGACAVAGARALGASDDGGGERLLLPLSRRRIGEGLAALIGVTGIGALLALVLIDTPKDAARMRRDSPLMTAIDALTSEGDCVLVATTVLWYPYPEVVLQSRAPGSRYLWLFPIPMLQAVHSLPGDPEGDFVRDVAEDIRTRRPKLILLQKGWCFGCGSTTVDTFFRAHPPLVSALEDYSLKETLVDGLEFDVLLRTDSPRGSR